MDRYMKMDIIANVVDEEDFLNKYSNLIKSIVRAKKSQLKTKVNNTKDKPYIYDEGQDLYNDGVIVLFESLDRYDVSIGKVKFSTFFSNHLKFWLNNNFKTNYTGIKCNSRAMQKQRDLYKLSTIESEKGNKVNADNLYNKANLITGKFLCLSKNSQISMDNILDTFQSNEYVEDNTYKQVHNILNEVLPQADCKLIKRIYGIGTDKISTNDLSNELKIDRSTLYRQKKNILSVINKNYGVLSNDNN